MIGVSGDSLQRHRDFAARRALPFLLVSDQDGALRKSLPRAEHARRRAARVTYVIDKQGIVRHAFAGCSSAERHVAEALKK